MQNKILRKGLVAEIIFLFIGLAFVPSFNAVSINNDIEETRDVGHSLSCSIVGEINGVIFPKGSTTRPRGFFVWYGYGYIDIYGIGEPPVGGFNATGNQIGIAVFFKGNINQSENGSFYIDGRAFFVQINAEQIVPY
jgi:hypothetical protein